MEELSCFRIGGDKHNYLQVEVLGRLHPGQSDFWDGNWLDAKIRIEAGSFKGSYGASQRSEEFLHFLDGLSVIYTSLGTAIPTRVAEFSAMEEQLGIVVRGDAFGVGNRLEFELNFDQTEIPAILGGLQTVIEAFPVRGNPSD